MRRQRHSAEQWAAWLEEFQTGDFTIVGFCKLKGVCTNSFYQWRKKLAAAEAAPTFVPVEISADRQVEIDLPGGATIRVPSDPVSLRPVLAILCELGARP